MTDWTKLSTTAAFAKNVRGLNGWAGDKQTDAVEAGTRAWLWKTMLPIAYSQIAVTPKGGNTVDGTAASPFVWGLGNAIGKESLQIPSCIPSSSTRGAGPRRTGSSSRRSRAS